MKKFWDWALFWSLIIVSMPFLLGVLTLEAYGPSGTPLTDPDLCNPSVQASNLDSGKITYVAVTSLHFVVCAIIILRYSMFFIDTSKASRKCKNILRGFIGPIFLLFLLFFFILSKDLIFSDFKLSYSRLASAVLSDFYCVSDIAPVFSLVEFEIASTLPVVAGIMATAILVAYASLQVRLFVNCRDREHERARQFSASYQSIMRCLPMSSCILVTAVISSAVWFHLPVKIFEDVLKDKSALQALRNYGDEMTLFLGVTYTLTVLVAVAWPMWRLSRRVRELNYVPELKSDWRGTNREAVLLANKILAVLAPLITSLLYNWLEGSS